MQLQYIMHHASCIIAISLSPEENDKFQSAAQAQNPLGYLRPRRPKIHSQYIHSRQKATQSIHLVQTALTYRIVEQFRQTSTGIPFVDYVGWRLEQVSV
jgi:hypothetical protein